MEETIPPGTPGADLPAAAHSQLSGSHRTGRAGAQEHSQPHHPEHLCSADPGAQLRPAPSSTTPSSHPLLEGLPSAPPLHTQRAEKDPLRTGQEGKVRAAHTKPLQTHTNPGLHISRVNSSTHLPQAHHWISPSPVAPASSRSLINPLSTWLSTLAVPALTQELKGFSRSQGPLTINAPCDHRGFVCSRGAFGKHEKSRKEGPDFPARTGIYRLFVILWSD